MDKQLPIYELLISEDESSELEVSAVAFVDAPAIERNFMCFKKIEPLAFAATNEEQREVFGAAMIPDMPIFRSDNTGDYYVTFSKETIRKISQKFYQNSYQSKVNIGHDPNLTQDGVTFFQSFINDGKIASINGYAEGTWFLGAKINNDELWAKVKSGEVKGFSVEGMFSYEKKKKTPEQIFEEIKQLLSAVE